MTSWLRTISIRTKILLLVMVVTTVTLILAAGSLLAWDYREFRVEIAQELSTQAHMVIENSAAAMSFQDRTAASETLESLASNLHIRIGCLYDAEGALFVVFDPRKIGAACPARPPRFDSHIGGNVVSVVVRTRVAGSPGGSVYLESDLDAVTERARVQALTAGLVLAVALAVALLLSTLFSRAITGPVDALVLTVRDVSVGNDYSLRARKTTGDELGVLIDAFNSMLSQIEHAERERGVLLDRERETNRLKDEFLMTLSHELRTPLNAIQGWTNLLSAGAIAPEGIPPVLERIERNVEAQARLIEDLLEVSRFAAGKFRLEPVPVEFVQITNQAVEDIRSAAEARQITVTRHFETSSAPMHGDPNRLQQVIWNLLSNAVKFSPPSSTVVVTIRQCDTICELVVHDTGIGIDSAFLPFVFEPFRQADASNTRAYGGLGLGLSLVRRIVELHGGDITAASPGIGRGATFTVRLPLATAQLEGDVRRLPGAAGLLPDRLAGVNILIVDDDDDARELLAALLEAAGARVRRAASGTDALQMARRPLPDVLISDVAMPGLDGLSLLKGLRRSPATTPRVAIALTAQATASDRDRALAAGFDRHVSKPFDQIALIALIRETLAKAS